MSVTRLPFGPQRPLSDAGMARATMYIVVESMKGVTSEDVRLYGPASMLAGITVEHARRSVERQLAVHRGELAADNDGKEEPL